MNEVLEIRTNLIKVGDRFRKDMGDLDNLAASIKDIGLLQPIGIDSNYRLIFGERRLRACEKLGLERIAARFVDVAKLVAEHAENEVRKDFTVSERVAISKAIEDEIGNRRGQRTDLKEQGQGDFLEPELSKNFCEVGSKRTDQVVAKKAGFGNETTLRQAKAVVEKGEPELIAAMDRGDIAISTAAKLATATPETQNYAAANAKKAVDLAKKASLAKVREMKATVTEMATHKRDTKKAEVVAKLEAVSAQEVITPTGLYDVIVLDPPWPMQKIDRDERPNQVAFDYPTMSEEELAKLVLPADEDCHIWLWTTHKYLPMAFRLLDKWGLKYVCTFVWHKPGGFQPIGLPQYNCEMALYARKGTPSFVDTKAFPVCFNAPRGQHSEKPEEFYEVVRRVTRGRRLDMFNRRAIAGFTGWGQEAAA